MAVTFNLDQEVSIDKYNIVGKILITKNDDSYLIAITSQVSTYSIPGWIMAASDIANFKSYHGVVLSKNISNYVGDHVLWQYGKELKHKEQLDLFSTNNIIGSKPKARDINNMIDGAFCVKCKDFLPYAEDGVICWSCKSDPYRLSLLNAEDDY